MAPSDDMSISSLSLSCIQAFDTLCSSLQDPDHVSSGHLSLSSILDEKGRFRVWAGNLGAWQVGHSSLDYRLREADLMRGKVRRLLEDLESALQEAESIVSGRRKPFEVIGIDVSTLQHTRSSSSTFSSDDDSNEDSDAEEPEELELIFASLVDVVDCLYKLSMLIRKKSPRGKAPRAATVDVSHFEPFDIQHVRARFPLASDQLTIRLGKSISRRRQYFKYREKHHDKLSQGAEATLRRPMSLVPSNQDQSAESIILPQISQRKRPESTRTTPTRPSQTTATTFVGQLEDALSEREPSVTSAASSLPNLGDMELRIPPPPQPSKRSLDGIPQAFQCPYCFAICPPWMGKTRRWKEHVLGDLQPYICTSQNCRISDQLFDNREEWFEHELQAHAKEYRCEGPNHSPVIFSARGDVEEHMRGRHAGSFAESQLSALVDVCERSVDTRVMSCCLCGHDGLSRGFLSKHLGRHLEQLALFALPRVEEAVEEGTDVASNQSEGYVDSSRDSFPESEDSFSDIARDEVPVDSKSDTPLTYGILHQHLDNQPRIEDANLSVASALTYQEWDINFEETGSKRACEPIYRTAAPQEELKRIVEREAKDPHRLDLDEADPGMNYTLVYLESGRTPLLDIGVTRPKRALKVIFRRKPASEDDDEDETIITKLLKKASEMFEEGTRCHDTGDLDEAEVVARQALKSYETRYGFEHPTTLSMVVLLAKFLFQKYERLHALRLFGRAVDGFHKKLGVRDARTLEAMNFLGLSLYEQGQFEIAESYLRTAFWESQLTPGQFQTAKFTAAILGTLLYEKGDAVEAKVLLEQAFDGSPDFWSSPGTMAAALTLVHLYVGQDKLEEAASFLRRLLATPRKYLNSEHPDFIAAGAVLESLRLRETRE
ncbi:MAG: hypothetical protein M4579_004063, partial [Chaenotheca gracillima]